MDGCSVGEMNAALLGQIGNDLHPVAPSDRTRANDDVLKSA